MSKAIQVQDPSLKQDISEKGIANGYVPLDSSTKIDPAYLNITGLVLMGGWDADTNTPTLGDNGAGGIVNEYYIVTVAGNTLIDGNDNWSVKDFIVNDGSVWVQVVNPDSVTSVFGRQGAVVAQAGDYTQTDVGLPNVDNTADLDKPISDDTQTALDTKVTSPLPVASETIQGIARIGTQAEVDAGLLNDVFVTPTTVKHVNVSADHVNTPTYSLDCNNSRSSIFNLTLDANTVIETINMIEGSTVYLYIKQGSSNVAVVNLNLFWFGENNIPTLPLIYNGWIAVEAIFIDTKWLVTSVWGVLPSIEFVTSTGNILVTVDIPSGDFTWVVTEEDGTSYIYNTTTLSHTATVVGNTIVRLYCDELDIVAYTVNNLSISSHSSIHKLLNLAILDVSGNGVTSIGNLDNLVKLEVIRCGGNLSLSSIGNLDNLILLHELRCEYCNLVGIGSLDKLIGLVHINLSNNTLLSYIGNLSNLSALASLDISSTNIASIGVLDNVIALETFTSQGAKLQSIGSLTELDNLNSLSIASNEFSETDLDLLLESMYIGRANYVNPDIVRLQSNVGSPPSGVYQDATPPTTGLEFAFKLENDPDAEGFNLWSIVY